MSPSEPRKFEVLITAQEAYPRLEAAFLEVKSEVVASFRIFDPETKLRSKAARAMGDTWFDLIVDTLNRGVTIRMVLTDFDPVVRMQEHRYAWRCWRAWTAASQASEHPENLHVSVAMHPARVGLLPRSLLWPRSVKEVQAQLQKMMADVGANLDETPYLKDLAIERGGALSARKFPPPQLVPVTHHQKLAVFDAKTLYIGGLDVNERRYDTPQHQQAGSQTWHDVQVVVTGTAAQEARQHVLEMDDVFAGGRPSQTKDLLRTMSAKRKVALPFMSPRLVVSEIEDAHLTAIANAEQFIYVETQFFRDPALAQALAKRARQKPGLTLVMMLPAAPEDIAFSDDWGIDAAYGEHMQVKCLDVIEDAFQDRLFVGAPVQPRSNSSPGRDAHFGAPLVYLHAKVSIFDDDLGIVSSANLNGRSMRWDTEAGITAQSPAEVAQLKRRCFEHWLGQDAEQSFFHPLSARDAWASRAARNAQLQPENRKGFVVPYRIDSARKDARMLPGVPSEMT
ncbi:phospholipase D family protein [Algirhabdus cladophorae]|uniref:phospholipase D family protein n=1 Tax=Algirhabdus cladophorae TaxID=3377108 RepID=UPI003B849C88